VRHGEHGSERRGVDVTDACRSKQKGPAAHADPIRPLRILMSSGSPLRVVQNVEVAGRHARRRPPFPPRRYSSYQQ
jgi:hypothetical protein